MRAGALIRYRLRLHGIPVRWLTRIEQWDPPDGFVDQQIRGPYALWHHTHSFEQLGPERTLMIDRVRYAQRLGPLGEIAQSVIVARDLERIFDYRRETIAVARRSAAFSRRRQMSKPSLIRKAYDATYGRAFSAFYDRSLAKNEEGQLGEYRAEIVGRAVGRTLELGAGTGLNLRHYTDKVTELTLTEPFGPMAKRLRARIAELGIDANVIETPAESLPFDNGYFDTVISTLVLCTVEDQAATLTEVARVLKPGGGLLFLEHVRADSERLAKWQDRLHGPWYAIGHGCNCNRDTLGAIGRSQLEPGEVTHSEFEGVPPLVRPLIRGEALLPT